jgi:hypothetical protein
LTSAAIGRMIAVAGGSNSGKRMAPLSEIYLGILQVQLPIFLLGAGAGYAIRSLVSRRRREAARRRYIATGFYQRGTPAHPQETSNESEWIFDRADRTEPVAH